LLLSQLPIDAPTDVYISRAVLHGRLRALVAQPFVARQAAPYSDGDVIHTGHSWNTASRQAPRNDQWAPAPVGNQTTSCAALLERDAWYEGEFVAAHSAANPAWTWQSCAQACENNVDCMYWTVQLPDGMCHLLARRTHRHTAPRNSHVTGACPVELQAERQARARAHARHKWRERHRVGIATTIKGIPAPQLAYWVDYHLRLGVRLIIIYAEDDEERTRLQTLLQTRHCPAVVWRRSQSARFEPRMTHRQDANLNDAVAGCLEAHCARAVASHCALHRRPPVLPTRALHGTSDASSPREGGDDMQPSTEPNPCEASRRLSVGSCPVDWLLQIDVDELLYVRPPHTLTDAVASASGRRLLHLRVREVAKTNPPYRLSSSYNFFRHERYFWPGARLSYAGGKGGGLVSCRVPPVRAWVHRWSVEGANEEHESNKLMVLHYPFCHYSRWRVRYNILSTRHSTDWGFYRQSRLILTNGTPSAQQAFYSSQVFTSQQTGSLEPLDVEALVQSQPTTCPKVAAVGKTFL
jgi:hypothetical protein